MYHMWNFSMFCLDVPHSVPRLGEVNLCSPDENRCRHVLFIRGRLSTTLHQPKFQSNIDVCALDIMTLLYLSICHPTKFQKKFFHSSTSISLVFIKKLSHIFQMTRTSFA